MTASTASVIGVLAARARRRIATHFFAMHAISAEDAVAYVPQRLIDRRQFDHMQVRGIVREAIKGHYWLDVAAYQADIERRRRILVPIVIALCVLAALVLTLGYKG